MLICGTIDLRGLGLRDLVDHEQREPNECQPEKVSDQAKFSEYKNDRIVGSQVVVVRKIAFANTKKGVGEQHANSLIPCIDSSSRRFFAGIKRRQT